MLNTTYQLMQHKIARASCEAVMQEHRASRILCREIDQDQEGWRSHQRRLAASVDYALVWIDEDAASRREASGRRPTSVGRVTNPCCVRRCSYSYDRGTVSTTPVSHPVCLPAAACCGSPDSRGGGGTDRPKDCGENRRC